MPASLFSRLPRELRLQIYHNLFPDRRVPANGASSSSSSSSSTTTLRHDGARTCTAVLRLNRAFYADALPALYARAGPFDAHVSRAGTRLCGGRVRLDVHQPHRSAADIDPAAVLPFIRILAVTITVLLHPWPAALDAAVAQTACFAEALGRHARALRELRVGIEWANGAAANFPFTFPTPEMAGRVLAPFVVLGEKWAGGEGGRRSRMTVVVGRIGRPRWEFGRRRMDGEEEGEGFEGVKAELRAAFAGGRKSCGGDGVAELAL